ncbi:MAG TPA: hypothetical protein VJ782_11170 [Aeromicrobium sp.]|nr:hypothetical protein [Aeromicrobium sp.]
MDIREPDGLAEPHPRRSGEARPSATKKHHLTANIAAVGLLLAVVAGVFAWQRPWESADGPATSTIPSDARARLTRQFQDLSDARSRSAFLAAAGDSDEAHRAAGDIWDARRTLGVQDVAFVYRRGGQAPDRADGSTSAEVDVAWRGGSSTVRFRLWPTADGFDLMSVTREGGDPVPIWLAGNVGVKRADGATVITINGGEDDIDAVTLARRAAGAVNRLVPTARGRLTVVVPKAPATAAAVLGRPARGVAQIAAVSTALGGPKGVPAIVVNPELFGGMDDRAQRIVMTHEATHVLSGLAHKRSRIELWVAEGFADYVALHDDRAPLSVSAGQILRKVRADGAPPRLPSAADFDESTHGLSTVYEAAWMVFRMLGEQHGDVAVRGFYTDVVDGRSVDEAARQWFGTTVKGITADWRRYLTKSASTVS